MPVSNYPLASWLKEVKSVEISIIFFVSGEKPYRALHTLFAYVMQLCGSPISRSRSNGKDTSLGAVNFFFQLHIQYTFGYYLLQTSR